VACVAEVPDACDTNQAQPAGWHAHLSLDFRGCSVAGHQRTVLQHCHHGPLRIQKALYPEGPHCCHAVVVHPPGGIAAGDELEIEGRLALQSHALVTTPSATKWYGSFDGANARQVIKFDVQGCLEWLPAETIIFDGARVESQVTIKLQPTGSMIGWDLLVFGRHASGERFSRGHFTQTLNVLFGEKLVWTDRLRILGADPLFESPLGLQGHHSLATLWAVAPSESPLDERFLEQLRQAVPSMAWTMLDPRLVVGRFLADPVTLRTELELAWSWLKQNLLRLPARRPRLWAT
jgi:urease accessory protein